MLSFLKENISRYYHQNLLPEILDTDSVSLSECIDRLEKITESKWDTHTVDSYGRVVPRASLPASIFKTVFSGCFPYEKSAYKRFSEATASIQKMIDKIEAESASPLSIKEPFFDRVRGMYHKLVSHELKDNSAALKLVSLWEIKKEREGGISRAPATNYVRIYPSLSPGEKGKKVTFTSNTVYVFSNQYDDLLSGKKEKLPEETEKGKEAIQAVQVDWHQGESSIQEEEEKPSEDIGKGKEPIETADEEEIQEASSAIEEREEAFTSSEEREGLSGFNNTLVQEEEKPSEDIGKGKELLEAMEEEEFQEAGIAIRDVHECASVSDDTLVQEEESSTDSENETASVVENRSRRRSQQYPPGFKDYMMTLRSNTKLPGPETTQNENMNLRSGRRVPLVKEGDG